MTEVVNKLKEKYDIYIGRESPFGNPFVIGKHGTREEVIEKYKEYFYKKLETDLSFKQRVLKLKNHILGCYCRPENKCHGDIIQNYVDSYRVLAIIGSRSFDDYGLLLMAAEKLNIKNSYTAIVSGGAIGADALGKKYANSCGLEYIEFLPNWDKFGKLAGYKRNVDIVKCADELLVFWDGVSQGTKHSLNLAKEMKKSSFVFYF